jgi:hypothetical protein
MSRSKWYREGKPTAVAPGDKQRVAIRSTLRSTRKVEAELKVRNFPQEIAAAVHRDRVEQAHAYITRLLEGRKPTDILSMTGTAAQFASIGVALEQAGYGNGQA